MFSKFWEPRSYFEPGKGRLFEEPTTSSEERRKWNWRRLKLKKVDLDKVVKGTEAALFFFSTANEKSPELLGPTIDRSAPDATKTIEKIPVEILCEIFLSALDMTPVEEKINLVINLCHTSHHLRRVALSTAKLWQGLDINLSIHDSSLVSEQDIGFMRWWAAVLWYQPNNHFSLRFSFNFLDGEFAPENNVSLLCTQKMQVIIGLIACARVLELNCIALTFLRRAIDRSTPTPLPRLEDLRIGRPKDYEGLGDETAREIYRFLALFDPPAIRRLALDHSLWQTQKTDRDRMAGAYWRMWPKLTEIDGDFTGEHFPWKTFFSRFISLERARISFSDSRDEESNHNDFDKAILPCLLHLELWLKSSNVDDVFEGFTFPALKCLVIKGSRPSISQLDRALLATPSLERIELIDISFDGVENVSSRLVNLLPHLEVITIDTTYVPLLRSKSLFIEYIGILERSGWLSGPWKKGSLTVELYCLASVAVGDWPRESYGFGQVNVIPKTGPNPRVIVDDPARNLRRALFSL